MSLSLPGLEAGEEDKLSLLSTDPADDASLEDAPSANPLAAKALNDAAHEHLHISLESTSSHKAPTAKAFNDALQDHLHVPFSGTIRAASPDTLSNLSVDDVNDLRRGSRGRTWPPHPPHPSRSPAPPHSFRARTHAFWLRNKGLALVLIAQLFGTLMNVTTRLLEIEGNNGKGLHPFQILFARMGITVVLASAYMWWQRTPDFPFGAREVRGLLVARGVGGFFGVFGMYYSLQYLPISESTVLTFLAPSLACWACSFLINEPFTRMEQIAALISLFGVVLIARPTSLFSASSPVPPASGDGDMLPSTLNTTLAAPAAAATIPDAGNYDNVTPQQRAMAVGIAMVGVLGAASAYTTIRWIGKRAHALITVNYFASWCTIVSIVMMFALPGVGFLLPANPREWCLLFFLGICGFVMQFLLAAGLAYEKSSRATNMIYTQMLFALAFDKLLWGTTPGALSIIGSSLILGSAIYVAVQKATTKPKEAGGENRDRDEERGLVEGMDAEDGVEMVRVEEPGEERAPVQEIQLRAMRV